MGTSSAPAGSGYVMALAVCLIVQAAFAITFALCARVLPRR